MNELLSFFLGGHDLEMVTIRDLLADAGQTRVFDKQLAWGARASVYREEIEAAIRRGETPVLIELPDDLGLKHAVVIVDHHGARAGHAAPTSLHQVFDLLQLPPERWTRWLDLVAANDRGHIREMRQLGATPDEIDRIRRADRAAQGVTEKEEREAANAVEAAKSLAGGRLIIVHLPHRHSSAAADRLEILANPPENVLVISPGEVNFYGRGDVIASLERQYPGGWRGGALPDRGFWGHAPVPDGIEEFLASAISND